MLERYFDNASTTPVDPRVFEAMLPFLSNECGNADSIHQWGRSARNAVEEARSALAMLLGAEDPSEIIFTSGATEANNWVISQFSSVAISPFEHASVREPALRRGAEVLQNSGYAIESSIRSPDLLSVMLVNNETGAIIDSPETTSAVHRDVTQGLGKVEFNVKSMDFASMSAHKLYGPKGAGALYVRGARFLEPLLLGGSQESSRRAGTLNVPGIVGFGRAAELARLELGLNYEHALDLRSAFLSELESPITHDGGKNSPYILSLSFSGIQGESLVIELDRRGFGVSAGAACSAASPEPSHVLQALDIQEPNLRGTIRVSMGRFNTIEAALELGRALQTTAAKLQAACT